MSEEKEKKGFFSKLFGGFVNLVTFRWLFKHKEDEYDEPRITPITQEELDEAQENENESSESSEESREESSEKDSSSSSEKDDEKDEEEGYEREA